MGFANGITAWLLQSPCRRTLDGSTDLVRYQGRRSGTTHTTPTQFATHFDGIVILVARSGQKTWWRNFVGGHDLDVLLRGTWVPMIGIAVVGAEEPEMIRPLLESYLHRYPRLANHLPENGTDSKDAVVVWCRPRDAPAAG